MWHALCVARVPGLILMAAAMAVVLAFPEQGHWFVGVLVLMIVGNMICQYQ